jgi:hypothetical protein
MKWGVYWVRGVLSDGFQHGWEVNCNTIVNVSSTWRLGVNGLAGYGTCMNARKNILLLSTIIFGELLGLRCVQGKILQEFLEAWTTVNHLSDVRAL